jgi:uncharacterized protein YjiS (DUF1127 family)
MIKARPALEDTFTGLRFITWWRRRRRNVNELDR